MVNKYQNKLSIMNQYTIPCTIEQTKKALELGAPIITCENKRKGTIDFVIPTAEQMIGWLRTKGFRFAFDDDTNYWNVCVGNKPITVGYGQTENKELAAIDATLEYLTNQNQ